MSSVSLRLEDVSVRYGELSALRGVDLEVRSGEAVALVGPSGAGKTTLLRLLCGTVRPAGGRIEVEGHDLSRLGVGELRRLRAGIGFIHQDLALVPNLRAVQNVLSGRLGQLSLAASLRTLLFPPRRHLREVYEILARVVIPEKLYERTDRLSGGERQRVAIARALFQHPTVLLADEPVASVDPARARETVRLLTEISRERGLTLCVSLHNLELAREFFPRLVGLRHGRVAFDRPPDRVGEEELGSLYELATEEGA